MADLEQFFGKVVDVLRRTDGDELTAAAGIAETVLHVGDTADFDETGGVVQIGAETYTYDELDHDANTITLTSGLLEAAAEGDRVDVIDEELNQVVVEYVAHVLMEDQDRGDEPIEVTVQHSLVNLLAESVRGGVTESVTLLRDGDDDLVIWQVDGKIVEDIALEEVKGGYAGTLQDIYDEADAAAQAALDAATAADFAYDTANGRIRWSLNDPGSTPNNVGDVWFKKDLATQDIIGQWEGLGGTSWQSKQIRNEVIANLDAGKLVAGSAFINGLWIKTNLTLGDASTNGVIQSHNFAGSSVGVFMDKNGLVAKGGSMTGATITGGIVRTGGGSNRVQMLDNGTQGTIDFYYGGAKVGWLTAHSSGLTLKGPASTGLQIFTDRAQTEGDLHVGGSVSASGAFKVNQLMGDGGNITVYNTLAMNGNNLSGVAAFTSNGTNTLNDLGGTGGSSFVMVGNSGVLSRGAVSSLRYKENVKPLEARVAAALLQVDTITWQYKDRKTHGDRRYGGVPAEQLHDLGLDLFVDYDAEGRPDQVRSWELVAPLIALCQQQQAEIDEERAARLAQQAQIDELLAWKASLDT